MMEDIKQGEPAWFAARLGKATGSKTADVMMAKSTAGYRNYMAQLTAERLTGTVEETFCSFDMQRGTELEPVARSLYCFLNNVEVVEVGFVDHPTIEDMGCSPDGIIGDQENDFPVGAEYGLIEIKCPKSAQHQDLLLGGKIDGKYTKQMQQQMSCTGAAWCDYCSYDPTMPDDLKLKVIRVPRDEKMITEIEEATIAFLGEVNERVIKLRSLIE